VSLESDLVDTLKVLVAGRVHRSTFPPPPAVPKWPAIRFVRVSGTNEEDIAGGGDEDTDDVLFQLDVVAKSPAEVDSLVTQVVTAMRSYPHPNVRVARRDLGFDPDTRTERTAVDYLVQLSSS